jgi:hypothetical protein
MHEGCGKMAAKLVLARFLMAFILNTYFRINAFL